MIKRSRNIIIKSHAINYFALLKGCFYEKKDGIKTEWDNKPEGKYTVLLKLICVYMKLGRN